ncbi:MAG TPA: hypothetical protein VHY84_23445 [Bryobacteraceae bacterium]|nr:hypothetical protein [Bryobacteraceae bacterium]
MKFPKVLTLTMLSLAVAAAASVHTITLYEPVSVGATQLKPGVYTVEMKGDKAIFKSGKNMVEVPATFGATDKKNQSTLMLTSDSKLREIDFGGTNEKILFAAEGETAAGTK